MSEKNLENYEESLPDAKDKDHMVVNGNLYLLFEPKVSALNERHMRTVEEKVVPFMLRAIKRLGPGKYYLHVYGAASATNRTGNNDDLAAARAYNAAMYAIKRFEERAAIEPGFPSVTIDPSTVNVSDQLSSAEAAMLRLKPHQIEKSQAAHRAAMFKFKAQLNHPVGANTFKIREIYKFKFQEISRPLPEFLEDLKKRYEDFGKNNPIFRKFFEKQVEDALDKIIEELKEFLKPGGKNQDIIPPQYQPLVYAFKYMVPKDLYAAFELADYRDQAATYQFQGEGHETKLSLSSLIGLVASTLKAFKLLSKIFKYSSKFISFIEGIEKKLDSAIEEIGKFNPGMAKELKILVAQLIDENPGGSFQIPKSEWEYFHFKDLSPDWDVRQQGGFAKVHRTILVGFENVRVEFGKPKDRNDWTFPADVVIDKSWSLLNNGLLGNQSITNGNFVLMSPQ